MSHEAIGTVTLASCLVLIITRRGPLDLVGNVCEWMRALGLFLRYHPIPALVAAWRLHFKDCQEWVRRNPSHDKPALGIERED